mgnify:FL=1|tara:strand:+ start:360 stop:623 length:264 start_codon:yes stop_codon:yes gene_type:complete
MDKYSFFTRKCIWYNVDNNVESAKVYIQDTFNLNKDLGEELKGMTGEEIIKYINKNGKNDTFLDICARNKKCYLYRSDMKIVKYNGD